MGPPVFGWARVSWSVGPYRFSYSAGNSVCATSGGLWVVEGVEVVDDFRVEFESCRPFLSIQQLCLHSGPERLDYGIFITIPHRFEAESQPEFVDVAGVCPRGELSAVVHVNDFPGGGWLPAGIRHVQSQVHQRSLWPSMNRPTHCFARKYV